MTWLALALLACTCGRDAPEPEEGKWFEARYRTHRFDPSLTDAQREQIEQLEAIGYADGTVAGSGLQSVTTHDPARAWQGLNFYASGHGPEAVLMDMDGRELHRWHHDFWDAFPRYPVGRDHGSTHNWRRAWLLPNGDVLAIHEGLGLVRIDKDSRLLWSNPGRAHHDLDFAADGTLRVLTREVHLVERLDPDEPIVEDFVSVLDPATGRELSRASLLEAVERSEFRWLLERREKADLFHTNTLVVLDGSQTHLDPAFAAGNLLLSMRNLSALVVVDAAASRVLWAHTGDFALQHEPSPTAAGELLLFDNQGPSWGGSRALAIALPTRAVTWDWRGPADAPLDSRTLGTVRELPNGDVLVTDSEQGRALEVDRRTGDVVWAFHNPHVAGPNGEYVAALFEVVRLPPDFPIDWARGARAPAPPSDVSAP